PSSLSVYTLSLHDALPIYDRGVLAHSDGDAVLHALCDAMLGALALGDIGVHFPPSDARWKGADSRVFVRHCRELLGARGWQVGRSEEHTSELQSRENLVCR